MYSVLSTHTIPPEMSLTSRVVVGPPRQHRLELSGVQSLSPVVSALGNVTCLDGVLIAGCIPVDRWLLSRMKPRHIMYIIKVL